MNLTEALPEKIPIRDAAELLGKKLDRRVTVEFLWQLHRCKVVKLERYAPDVGSKYELLHHDPNDNPEALKNNWTISREEFKQFLEHEAPAVSRELKVQHPIPRQLSQEQAILSAVRKVGYCPTELPRSAPGKPGVKSEILGVVEKGTIQFTDSIFKHAWERLLSSGQIAYVKI